MISHSLAASHQTKTHKLTTEGQLQPSNTVAYITVGIAVSVQGPQCFFRPSCWLGGRAQPPHSLGKHHRWPKVPGGQGGTTTAPPLSNFSVGEEEPLLPLLLYRNQAGEKTRLKANPEAQCEKSTLFAVLSVVKAYVCDYLGTFFFSYPRSSIFN